MSGRFIVLEGIDGSGKGTQLALLAERLTNAGHSVWLTREPTDGAIGRLIREGLGDAARFDEATIALLFAADRLAHIAEIRRVLQAARDDAVNGLINRDFVQKYIDRIFVTVDNDKIQLQIKLFTSESTMRYLEKLERRSGHTFKKMIESYEQNMANQG